MSVTRRVRKKGKGLRPAPGAQPAEIFFPAIAALREFLNPETIPQPQINAILEYLIKNPGAGREELREQLKFSESWVSHIFPAMVKVGFCKARRILQMAIAEIALLKGYSEKDVAMRILKRESVSGFVECFKTCHDDMTPKIWKKMAQTAIEQGHLKMEVPDWLEKPLRRALREMMRPSHKKTPSTKA
jgi:AraC-like DNA-binding protein